MVLLVCFNALPQIMVKSPSLFLHLLMVKLLISQTWRKNTSNKIATNQAYTSSDEDQITIKMGNTFSVACLHLFWTHYCYGYARLSPLSFLIKPLVYTVGSLARCQMWQSHRVSDWSVCGVNSHEQQWYASKTQFFSFTSKGQGQELEK